MVRFGFHNNSITISLILPISGNGVTRLTSFT